MLANDTIAWPLARCFRYLGTACTRRGVATALPQNGMYRFALRGNAALLTASRYRNYRFDKDLVQIRPIGFEPITLGSEDRCAIQLRHGRVFACQYAWHCTLWIGEFKRGIHLEWQLFSFELKARVAMGGAGQPWLCCGKSREPVEHKSYGVKHGKPFYVEKPDGRSISSGRLKSSLPRSTGFVHAGG